MTEPESNAEKYLKMAEEEKDWALKRWIEVWRRYNDRLADEGDGDVKEGNGPPA